MTREQNMFFPGIYHGREDGGYEKQANLMMKWCSTPSNITQCLQGNLDMGPTVDWICRDLANAAKWIGGSRG
jgi:hypothetical protein